MNSNNNKNLPTTSTRSTVQEFSLKQLFLSENIPFEFQKEFTFPSRSYFVDFFLIEKILLECSFTQSSQYDGVFRQKAILLEAKTAFIKRFFSYPMYVLFESTHTVGEKLFITLRGLMPSVDYFYTSKNDLLENLPAVFQNNHQKQVITSSNCPSPGNSNLKKTFQHQHDSLKIPSTPFDTNAIPNNSISSTNHYFINLHKRSSPDHLNCTQVIFSQNLNKHSTEYFSNFKVSNNSMEERLL